MQADIERIFFTEEQLAERVKELGQQISKDYQGLNPIFIGVLKGSFVFMADLMRSIDVDCSIDFMAVSSYGSGTKTTGAVKITKDLSHDIENRHVIIVEDILDSGLTLNYLRSYLEVRQPLSIKICTLMDKPARREAPISADYVGFDCPDAYIVGYGLDYAEKYRNLPYIGVLKPEIYQ